MNDEDIKILEILKETLIKDKFIIPKEPKKWCEAIENLLNRNKELEEYLKIATAMLTKGTYPSENEEDNNFEKQFIPKSKIKEKIEELEKYIYKGENAPQDFLQYRIKAKIQALQELLEEK